jgi:copper chaperone NosL
MTIVNPRFAAEIVTQKGKPYKFDDVSCLVAFLDKGNELKTSSGEKISGIYVADFSGNHSLVKAEECQFLQSEKFRSPMRGDIAAFSHPDSLNTIRQAMQGSPLSWKEVLASLE